MLEIILGITGQIQVLLQWDSIYPDPKDPEHAVNQTALVGT